MINIFIGPSVRNGGSLLNRLFDHHPDVAAYPFELFLPMDAALHPSLQSRGQKLNVQNFPKFSTNDEFVDILRKTLLSDNQELCLIGSHFWNGKLKAKTSFMNVYASYDHQTFLANLHQNIGGHRDLSVIYNAIHKTFFNSWDSGKHSGSMKFVAYHSGNGLLANIPIYLEKFENSYFIQPIRSIWGCLASEKKKIVRQLIGRGRIGSKINIPDHMLKLYFGRFFEQTIVNWLIIFTRAVILKKKLGNRYIIYRHEDLVRQPEKLIRLISNQIGLEFHANLLYPTLGGLDWRGNSMFGRQSGINPQLAEVRDVFNKTEKALVNKYCSYQTAYLDEFANTLVSFDEIDEGLLFDYALQESHFDDRARTALYFASLYERWKYNAVGAQLKNTLRDTAQTYFLDLG
jgi:hypothetical protein